MLYLKYYFCIGPAYHHYLQTNCVCTVISISMLNFQQEKQINLLIEYDSKKKTHSEQKKAKLIRQTWQKNIISLLVGTVCIKFDHRHG